RLREAHIDVPPPVTFVPLDFEQQALSDALAAAGFDRGAGALFAWLGVTPYLTHAAIRKTLTYVAAATRAGGGVVFDYALEPRLLTAGQRLVYETLGAQVRAAGEPWLSSFEPHALAEELRALGFRVAEDIPPAALNARYLANRTDGLQVGGLGHL